MKEFDATTLDGTYKNLGSALSNPAIKIQIFNTSDVGVYLSKDGSTNFMRIPAHSTLTLDESTLYFRGIDQEYYLPKSTQLTLTQVTGAGTLGDVICHVITRIQP